MADDKKIKLFSETPVPRAVATLAVPTVLSNLVALLYSLADTYFVGLLNDPVQTAAVTLAAPVLLAFNAVNNLFGVGSSSMMSRALGRGDMKTLRQSSAFGFYGALASGIAYSALCTALLSPLLGLLGADSVTAPVTERYMIWTVCLGATPSILNVVLAYMIRSEGATMHASIGTMSGCLINILLDPLFILPGGLNMGAEGAALATMISNLAAMLYFFGYLIVKRRSTCVCISPREFTLQRKIAGGVCAVGVPASIQNLLNVVSHTLLNNLAAPFGAEALAGMGIASRLGLMPWYISNGVSQGVMPLIGFNYASGNTKRMKHALRFTMQVAEAILCTMAVAFCVFSKPLTGLFIGDAQTVAYGASFLYGFSISVPLLALDFMAVAVFQAVGRGGISLVMALLRKLVLEIPALYVLNRIWPLYGLSCAQLFAELCMAIIGSLLLVRLLREIDGKQLSGGG